ncbi:MAG: hypothetical protein G01um101444_48 [Parcubacteria group bacterium Gr01-1014_44]|nr:MAG: hypothetical protein G01um101444_48 [Parcubacteria group bacterium Gr01-1014_44]
MITAIIFIIIIGILVLVHELGHFITAKRAGMKVEEFGFGFPPRLFGIKKGETIYSINWIPFGGFVKIYGESGDPPSHKATEGKEEADSPRSFASKKPGTRAKVIVAGVVMNVILAYFLLTVGNVMGLRTAVVETDQNPLIRDRRIQIIQIVPNTPADEAKLETLDEIIGFGNVAEFQEYINQNRGKNILVQIKRGGEILEKQITPRVSPPPGEGALGISLAATGVIKYPWYQAIYKGAEQTGILFINTVYGYGSIIGKIFTTGSPGADISGPIGIAKFTGQAARIGFAYLLQLTALISINLAVLNIIPFPALDGGRLLFIIIEKIKGSPIPRRVENLVNSIGFALLILLMIYVTTKDISRLF